MAQNHLLIETTGGALELDENPHTCTGEIVNFTGPVPAALAAAGTPVVKRFVEFFAAQIPNPHTRRAYVNAWRRFLTWCDGHELEIHRMEPVAIAAYVQTLTTDGLSAATVKQHLAALRRGYDYLVIGGVGLSNNPAAPVKGPKIRASEGKTPVLYEDDARAFLESIDTSNVIGLRDRAIIGVMVYSFARVSAVTGMRVRDFERQPAGSWFVLHEKGDKRRRIPAHSKAAELMGVYLEAAGIEGDRNAPLFQSTRGRSRALTGRALDPRDVLAMIKRRAADADFPPEICSHSWRATGITDYLDKGGRLEVAAEVAGHASTQTTRAYDRRHDRVRREEIERIRI